MAAPETLPVRFVRNPWVWSGVGLLVRYGSDPSTKATFWKTVAVISLAIGVGTTVASQDNG